MFSADTAIRMMNQRWREFYAELLPFLKPRINAIVIQNANEFVRRIPVQDVILDYPKPSGYADLVAKKRNTIIVVDRGAQVNKYTAGIWKWCFLPLHV